MQAGVKIAVDQGTQFKIPYVWCFANSCIAAKAVDVELIREMKSGQKMVLEAVDSSILTVATSLPLNDFAKINQAAPAQLFDQSLEGK